MPTTANRPATHGPSADGAPARRSLRILAADADPAAREFYHKAIPALGNLPCLAESGRQLLELCRAITPDLVVADARLPDTDGFELAVALCRERPVPVVLVSADPDAAAAWAAADCHVLAYLAKPLRAEALGAAVAVAVRCFERMRALGEEAGQLRQALEDRKVVERAKGILMRLTGLSEDEAYRRMRALATRGSRKVVEVARDVIGAGDVFTHLLDDGPHADGHARHPAHGRAHHNGPADGP
jgi:response regulator NasT